MFEVAVIVFAVAQFCVSFLILGMTQKIYTELVYIRQAWQTERIANAIKGSAFWDSKEM